MKLKTLKDLPASRELKRPWIKSYDEKDLKQEAIKWVKHYEKEMKEAKANYYCELVGAIREFIEFFNITEEDLR